MTQGIVTWLHSKSLADRVLLVRINDKQMSAKVKVLQELTDSVYRIEMDFIEPAYFNGLSKGQEFALMEASKVLGTGIID